MYTHPTITAALAEQHRRDLMSQASASRQARQARAARQGSSRNPARRPLIVGALRTAAAATAIAAGAFLVIPAGPAPAPSANANWSVPQVHSWGKHYRASDSHRAVLAVHWKSHRFSMDHHFQGNTRFADNPTGRWA